MARLESTALPFTHSGLDRIVKLYRDKLPKRYTQYVDIIDNKQGYYRLAQEGDFPAAGVVNQGTAVDLVDFQTGPYKDWLPIKRGIGFSVANEVIESDVTGIIRRRAPKMARSLVRTVEADMANNVNLATSTVVSIPGGDALVQSHTFSGGTFNNTITGNPALSVSSLEQAVQEMMIQPSITGDYLFLDGPYNLLVAPNNLMLAERITRSVQVPQSNNNDPNVVKGYIKNVIGNPFFTSPTAWMLVVADDEDNPLKMWSKRAPKMEEEFDKIRDLNIAVYTQIWTRMLMDWRGVAYSSGLGA